MPQIYRQKPQCKAQDSIHRKLQIVLPRQHKEILIYKCRKGSEATAEADCQKQPQLLIHKITSFKQAVKYADEKTASHIDSQCSLRENRVYIALH